MLVTNVLAAGNHVGIKWDGIKWFSRLYTVNAVMQAGGPGLPALKQICFVARQSSAAQLASPLHGAC